jgi:hypothetical protein
MSDETQHGSEGTDKISKDNILDLSDSPSSGESPTNAEGLTTYKSFSNESVARLLANLLDENGVEYLITGDGSRIPEIAGHQVVSYSVEIKPSDFAVVDELIEARSNAELDSVDPEYFVFSYSDDELIDILRHADEWSPLDVALSQKILKERGNPVSAKQIVAWREERLEESRQTKSIRGTAKVITYVVAIFFPIVGIVMGCVYAFSKKKDARGLPTPSYDAATKSHGKTLIYLALAMAIVAILVGMFIGPT